MASTTPYSLKAISLNRSHDEDGGTEHTFQGQGRGNGLSTAQVWLEGQPVVTSSQLPPPTKTCEISQILRIYALTYISSKIEKMTKHGETTGVFRRKIRSFKQKTQIQETVYKNIHPTGFKLLILENTVLNPADEVYLMV